MNHKEQHQATLNQQMTEVLNQKKKRIKNQKKFHGESKQTTFRLAPCCWLKIYAPAVAPLFSHSSPGHASRLKWMTAGRFVSWCHWWREGTKSVSSVLHRAWRCCLERWLHALSSLAKHSGDPKWTAFVQQSQRYSPSCAALNCDSKVRHYSYGWHEVSLSLRCVAQQLLIRAWLELSVCTC